MRLRLRLRRKVCDVQESVLLGSPSVVLGAMAASEGNGRILNGRILKRRQLFMRILGLVVVVVLLAVSCEFDLTDNEVLDEISGGPVSQSPDGGSGGSGASEVSDEVELLEVSGHPEGVPEWVRVAGVAYPELIDLSEEELPEFLVSYSRGRYLCGIKLDGTLGCMDVIDRNLWYMSSLPEGRFVALFGETCGLRITRELVCWSYDGSQYSPLSGRFKSVAIGGLSYGCAVRESGEVECWDDGEGSGTELGWGEVGGHADPPNGKFVMVAAGVAHTCGIRADDGGIECWGGYSGVDLTPPDGEFVAVSAKRSSGTCALRIDGRVECWGGRSLYRKLTNRRGIPVGSFVSIEGDFEHGCGELVGGETSCWGVYQVECPFRGPFTGMGVVGATSSALTNMSSAGMVAPLVFAHSVSGRNVNSFAVESFQSVGVHQSLFPFYPGRYPRCYAWAKERRLSPPVGDYVSLSVSEQFACGLLENASLKCWGVGRNYGQFLPPRGAFTDVATGGDHACGLRPSGAVECWGGHPFKFVCYDADYDTDNYWEGDPCWDYRWTTYGEDKPPAGAFVELAAGWWFTCGLRPTGEAECWGRNENGVTSPPEGQFTALTAGLYHACGLRTEGTVECWGLDVHGNGLPADVPFKELTAGAFHTCGLRSDGTAACWGVNTAVTSSPPEGAFSQLSSSAYGVCGLRPSGEVECWRGYDPSLEELRREVGSLGSSYGFPRDLDQESWVSDPSEGSFQMIGADNRGGCGIRSDGSVTCWSWPLAW